MAVAAPRAAAFGCPCYVFAGQEEAELMCSGSAPVPPGLWGIRYRARETDDGLYAETAARLLAAIETASGGALGRARLVCDFRPGLFGRVPADGWHLRISDLDDPSFPAFLSACRKACLELVLSAHSYEDLALAARHAIAYAVLSPVFEPLTGKGRPVRALGTAAVRRMVAQVPGLKVFGLGGICADRVSRVLGCGCFGVAGISLLRELQGR